MTVQTKVNGLNQRDPRMDSHQQTLCLNMIAKDKAPVIGRCLASVRPFIDYWVIVDTGSTDGTQDAIRTAMAGLPGELHEHPWRDFAHNRTEALKIAQPHGEYVLFIDADDVLEFEPDFTMPPLQADSYMVRCADPPYSYNRTQIVRAALPWRWQGILHEFLTCDDASSSRLLDGLRLRVNHSGAPRRDPQTDRRDAEILSAALQTETDPSMRARYQFYLAQAYRDCGEVEKALQAYLKRSELGFCTDETFISLLEAARIQESFGAPFDEIVGTYLQASDSAPHRAEALQAASRLCRLKNKFAEGYQFARRGLAIERPADGLYVEDWVYDYGLLDEFACNAFWPGAYVESLEACLKLLTDGKLPDSERGRVFANAKAALGRIPKRELGSLGQESLVDQHPLGAARALRTQLPEPAPRILVAVLAKQKAAALPLYLDCIEALDYPKSSIVLYIRTNNNTDRTEAILRQWIDRVTPQYAAVELDASNVPEPVETYQVHEWNATRFRVLGRIRQISLNKAQDYDCDFYFTADVDNFIRPCTLRELVALNLPVVAPFLRDINPGEPHSNFNAEVDDRGYFKDTDQHDWVLKRLLRGLIEVPLVHCTYLVRADVFPELSYADASGRYEYLVFSESARRAGIPQYLDNRQVYGYITFGEDCINRHVENGIEQAGALLHGEPKEVHANNMRTRVKDNRIEEDRVAQVERRLDELASRFEQFRAAVSGI